MAGKGTIGGKIVLEGEKEYREALKNIKTTQVELKSEMKLCQTTFRDSQNSMDALQKKYEILTKQVDSQTQKVEIYKNAIGQSAKNEKQAAEKTIELQKALEKAEKEMEEMEVSSGATSEAIETQCKHIDNLKNSLILSEQAQEKAAQKTANYRTSLNYAETELKELKDTLSNTEKYMEEAGKSTDLCAKSIDQYGKKIKTAGDDAERFGKNSSSAIDSLAEAIVAGGITQKLSDIVGVLKECNEESEIFETKLAKVSTIANTTEVPLQKIGEDILKISNNIGIGADAIAEATYSALSAGVSTADAVKFTEQATKLSLGGFTETNTAVDILTTTLNAYGLEADKTSAISDILITTQNLGKTTVNELSVTMGKVIPVAAAYNVELENLSTAYAILTANGIATTEATTYLKAMFTELGDTSSNVGKILEQETGKTFAQLSEEGVSFGQVIEILNKSVDGNKTKFNMLWNSTEAGVGALSLLGAGTEKYSNVLNQMKKSTGATEEAFSKMVDTSDMAKDKMVNSLKNLKIAIGDSLKPTMEDLYKTSDDVLQKSAEFVRENPEIVQAVVSLTAGIAVFTGGITAAKMAVIAFNAVVGMNPIVLVTAACVAAGLALTTYIATTKDGINAVASCTEETIELVEATEKLNEQYRQSMTERTNARQGMEQEAVLCQNLVSELEQLQSKSSLTAVEQNRMKMIVSQLNSTIPDLNLAIDEQTGKLNLSTDALKKNVEAMMSMAKTEAARADAIKIAEEQYEAEKQLFILEEQLEEQKKESKKAQQEYNEVLESKQGILDRLVAHADKELQMAEANLLLAEGAQTQLTTRVEETKTAIASFSEEYEQTMEYIAGNETLATSIIEMESLGGTAVAVGGYISEMSQEAQTAFTEMYMTLSDTISSQISLFEEFNGKSELSTTQLLSNMQSQVDGITQWSANLETLADRGINQGLLKKLAEMGPEGAGYVSTFVTMTDEELQKANALWQESLTLPSDSAEAITTAYTEAGDMAVQGFKAGIKENSKGAQDEAKFLGEGTLMSLKSVMMIQSPSKATKEMGLFLNQGLEIGIREGKTNVLMTTSNMASEVIRTAQSGLNSSIFINIGKQITEGLKNGIDAGKSGVIASIQRMCSEAVSAGRKELDINSPSKKFYYMGDMSGEGYIQGWKTKMANVSEVIAHSLPDTTMKIPVQEVMENTSDRGRKSEKGSINVKQEINVLVPVDNLVEMSRKFKQSQKEAAEAW